MTSIEPATAPIELQRSDDGERWVAVTTVDRLADLQTRAGELAEVADANPSLLLAFVGSATDHREAQSTIRSVFPQSELLGCTTSGMVGARADRAALQLVALGGVGFQTHAELVEYDDAGCRVAGQVVTEAVTARGDGHQALMLLCDGLKGDVAELIRGAYSISGAGTTIVGGCAGDDLAMVRTYQFANDRSATGGVAAAALKSSAPIGVGLAHGWATIGESMVITQTDGTSVVSIDDSPAMEAYLDVVGAGIEFESSAEFARFAQTRPLGLQDGGAGQVRFVTGGDFERQSLEFLVHIPEGQLVWVMDGDRASVIEATATATRQALDQLGTNRPLGVVAFDCVARRSVIGSETIGDEIEALRDCLPPSTPIGGFYTYGEIARTGGSLGLHHQTMVVVAFG